MTSTPVRADAHDVVVGVDGSAASVNAVRYAFAEAARTRRHVRVIHVLPDYTAPMYAVPEDMVVQIGESVIPRVLAEVGPAPEGVRVTSVLRRGPAAHSLVADSRGAHVVVAGADRRSALAHLLTGNTTAGVAAGSAPPTVAVPESWDASRTTGLVVVGLKPGADAPELLAEAFTLATERGGRLRVVHAWKVATAYEDLVADHVTVDEWAERALKETDALLVDWRAAYPGVLVEVDVVNAQPARTLVDASRDADELVLLRRAHGFPTAAHLGATARTVLREAHCPVRIVPPGHASAVPGRPAPGGTAAA